MPIRVLIVDDSSFMRHALRDLLELGGEIQIAGFARNGQESIEQTLALRPDVITMDVEMPVMDGVTAVRHIMRQQPTPILMFSSLTEAGAKATLDALEAGALDFLPKHMQDIDVDLAKVGHILRAKVQHMATARVQISRPARAVEKLQAQTTRHRVPYRLLLIGASTGGPKVLQEMISRMPGHFPLPIVIVQHMPASFTTTFAERMNHLSALQVKEAQHGDRLQSGWVYVAPGGKQIYVDGQRDDMRLRITEPVPGEIYKPSVDIAFRSAAESMRDQVLALVMTGMGSDGRVGAEVLAKAGSTVWGQNEASCVVYGMPKAVAEAGVLERVVSPDTLPDMLCEVA